MRIFLISALLLLAACSRGLSPNEKAFIANIHGDPKTIQNMRLHDGNFASSVTFTMPVRPRTTCQEKIWPPITEARTVTVSPVATVLFNTVFYRNDLYSRDLLPAYPEAIDLPTAMLLAHEATHVWQWQNRDRTGYTPFKALREHQQSDDPYLFDEGTQTRFLDFGYEQQGSIVEEYVCCHLLDPDAARTKRLRDLIAQEMPIQRLEAALDRPIIGLPWRGIEVEGICSGG